MIKMPDAAYEFHRLLGRALRPFESAYVSRKLASSSPSQIALTSEKLKGCELYHFQVSPFSARVRVTLANAGVEIPMHDVLEDSAAWQELVNEGGKDQVPCLKIERTGQPDQWMYESADIVKFIKEQLQK